MSDSRRLLSARIIEQVLAQKGSLTSLLARHGTGLQPRDKAFIQALSFGVCRHYHALEYICRRLLEKPIRNKDRDLQALLLCGLYQLLYMRVPAHAAINETVMAARTMKKPWAGSLLNAVLREAQRQWPALETEIAADFSLRFSHPDWMIDRFKRDWPQHYQALLAANNEPAPMSLRVHRGRRTRENYMQALAAAGIPCQAGMLADTAVILAEPLPVDQLPGFAAGDVSIQDEASQLAAALLAPAAGQRVLDACAAPGGKSCALLEFEPGIELLAVDNDALRLQRVSENLERCGLQAKVLCADIARPDSWWDGSPFDRILLDVPCSGTGVIRRHPDIKMLRSDASMPELLTRQAEILDQAWHLLVKGGRLLYSTCSVFRAENTEQVGAFVDRTPDAQHLPLQKDWGLACGHGRQLLPGMGSHDGFFYALLQKC